MTRRVASVGALSCWSSRPSWRQSPPGISTIETEFLANIVLPDNTTAGEWMLPQIDRAYRTGEMPPMLPAAGTSDPRSSGPIPLPPA